MIIFELTLKRKMCQMV